LSAYKNDYQAAAKKLVDAKRKGKSLPTSEPEPTKKKVVNLMDALRNSLAEEKKLKRTAAKKTGCRKSRITIERFESLIR
jgi:DNA end-binding protein Ku